MAELLRCEHCGNYLAKELRSFRYLSRSPIARNPDLAAFILACSMTMTGHEIHRACAREFGKRKAPSKSAIYRFLKTLQEGCE
ncbi:hypothetical protein HBA92_12520 [Ochrobactrum sp. MR28]|nr:hypothetical protein [Ochrobactrum sp. MR28]MBX8816697.1 hypothetical protein [Ochrobactrum sp. MR31]